MKLVEMDGDRIGLFAMLPKGPHAIDIIKSLDVFRHDPVSNGLLNGALKDGPDWSIFVKHWTHLRWPLKRLESIALASPDHPSLVLQSLTGRVPTANIANPITAIEITDIERFEEHDPTGRRVIERQLAPSSEANAQ
jgi:hypothetical protein